MKKLLFIIGITMTLMSCQKEEVTTEETVSELDLKVCTEISSSHVENILESEDNPDLWVNDTINIVLDDFSALDENFEVNHEELLLKIFNEFEQETGLVIKVFEQENAPEDYVFYQHAFWNGSSIGYNPGRSQASTGTYTIRNNPETIKHFLAHLAGSRTGNVDEVRELYGL